MNRIFTFELPFDYAFYLTPKELFFWGALLLVVIVLIVKSFFIKVQGGREGLANQKVVVLSDFSMKNEKYEGQVLCMGEIWNGRSDFPLKKGDRSVVSYSKGLMLFLSAAKTDEEE